MSDYRQSRGGRGSLSLSAQAPPYSQPADRYPEGQSDQYEENDSRPHRSRKPKTSSSHKSSAYASYQSTPPLFSKNYEIQTSTSGRHPSSEAESSRRNNYARGSKSNPSPPQQVLPSASTPKQPVPRSAQATRTLSAPDTHDNGPVVMSDDAIAFIKFSRNELQECAAFVDHYPSILDEGLSQFRLAAMRAFASGQEDFAFCIVHRLLIIKRCEKRSVRGAIDYIRDLANTGAERDEFWESYQDLVDAMRKEACTARPQPQAVAGSVSVATESTITQQMERATIESTSASSATRGKMRRMSSSKGYAPPPTLHESQESGVRSAPQDSSSVITGAEGTTINKKSLHSGYRVQKEGFFVVGKVFKVLWHQPAGADLGGNVSAMSSQGLFGEPIYSTLRWMIVVKRKPGYCICCPISTYGKKGLIQKNFHPGEIQAHAIVYSDRSNPVTYTTEPKLEKRPIPIVLDSDETTILPSSRVHFGKYHTVEYNVKVMGVGHVHEQYLDIIVQAATSEF